jgi:FSR family fosmidomycin resistance protein-like MFS transporter
MSAPSTLAAERVKTARPLPLTLFCLGHFFIDLYSSALGTMQPVLLERFRLSYTQAGILAGVLVFSSSVIQPVYGYLSDRWHSRLFTVLGPAMAGIFIATLGWAPGYAGLLAMVALGGAGIASFHPQAAANAVAHVRQNRARAMAVFVSSGSLGMAAGPLFFGALTKGGTLGRTPWGMLPGLLMTVLLVAWMPPIARGPLSDGRGLAGESACRTTTLAAVWRPMTILYFLVVIRSVVQVTFTHMLPLYLHTQRNYSLGAASLCLSLYLLGGALGGMAGGTLADRYGGRRVIVISMIGSVPLLALFVFGRGAVSLAGLFLGGLVLLFTIPVNVVMAQDLAPAQAGTVSALMMGFGWGMAGLIFIPLTGWVSDVFSMQWAFTGLIAFPIIGFLLALKLPRIEMRRQECRRAGRSVCAT